MNITQLESPEDRKNVANHQRYYLGMFHDGTRYQIVAWNWGYEPNKLYFFFNEGSGLQNIEVEMPKIDLGIIRWSFYRVHSHGQFDFLSDNGSVILSSYARYSDNVYESDEIGFKLDPDGKFNWVYIRQRAGAEVDHANIIRIGDYDKSYPHKIRDQGYNWVFSRAGIPYLEDRIIDRPLNFNVIRERFYKANKFTVGANYLYYFSNSKVFIYSIEKSLLKQVAKLAPCGYVVDVKVSPDGQTLLVVTKSAAILYRIGSWEMIRTFTNNNRPRRGCLFGCWSLDGLTFATMSPDFVQVWDLD